MRRQTLVSTRPDAIGTSIVRKTGVGTDAGAREHNDVLGLKHPVCQGVDLLVFAHRHDLCKPQRCAAFCAELFPPGLPGAAKDRIAAFSQNGQETGTRASGPRRRSGVALSVSINVKYRLNMTETLPFRPRAPDLRRDDVL